MLALLHTILTNPLLLSAFIASALASLAGGTMGSYVVVKRISFLSGAISHAILGGMGIGLWLNTVHGWSWLTPTHGALITALISAILIGWIHLYHRQREDSLIAAIWSLGMAVGVVFISKTPNYSTELLDFLVGNILWVSPLDLYLLIGLDVLLLIFIGLFHQRLLAICFDEEQSRLQGVSVNALYILLLVLISLSVVILMQVVGAILVMTMLTLPATVANLFAHRLKSMMLLAVILNLLFCWSGIGVAYLLDWPVGATITLVTGVVYLCSLVYRKQLRSR